MAEIPSRPQGNATAVPKPTETEPPIEWVTKEEAEKLDKLIFKPFIRRRELKEGDNKKFFYRITGVTPYVPLYHSNKEVVSASNENLLLFTVTRYHRNKYIEQKRREQGQELTEKVNEPILRNRYDESSGTWECVDPDTDFRIDARKFQEVFVRDTE
jgi:hypothetical protein